MVVSDDKMMRDMSGIISGFLFSSPNTIMKTSGEAECAVWGALELVLRVCSFLGLAPLKFRKLEDQTMISISPTKSAYGYFLAFTITTITLAGVAIDFNLPPERAIRVHTQMSSIVWIVDLLIVLLITNFGICGSRKRMELIIPCIFHINMILTKLHNNRLPHYKETRGRSCVIGFLIMMLFLGGSDIYTFVHEALTQDRDMSVVCMNSLYYIQTYITVTLEMQFVFTALLAHTALRTINQALTELLFSIDSSAILGLKDITAPAYEAVPVKIPIGSTNVTLITVSSTEKNAVSLAQTKTTAETLHRLALTYTAVCDVVRRINHANGLVVLLLLGSYLIHMIVTPYYFIAYLLSPKMGKFAMSLQFGWCVYHIIKLLAIVEPGHRTEAEIDITQVLIGQLMSRVSTTVREPLAPTLETELRHFCRQVELNKVAYSPLGMCNLTRPLIATLLGGVTTYLVIIVQYQSSDNWQISENVGVLLLLLLVSILIHLVETPYHFIQWLLNPQGEESGFLQFAWCAFHVATLLAVVEPGFKTAIEIDSIQVLLSQLMSRVTLNDPMAAELDLFCRQVALNKVSYTPMGMCVLSRGLISTILGAVTTYLVIIVQFQTL